MISLRALSHSSSIYLDDLGFPCTTCVHTNRTANRNIFGNFTPLVQLEDHLDVESWLTIASSGPVHGCLALLGMLLGFIVPLK